jgi:hypothetical protein
MLGAFLAAKDSSGIGYAAWARRERGREQRRRLLRSLELGRRLHSRLPAERRVAADAKLRRSVEVSDVALEQRIKRALRLYKADSVFAARADEWRSAFKVIAAK